MKTNKSIKLFSIQTSKTTTMKKLFFLVLLFTGIVNAQIVNIPDNNFKAKLIALGVDTSSDGQIQNSEAIAISTLDVSNSSITDMTGISSFTNLNTLICSYNQISSIDCSSLASLATFHCRNNLLSTLNLNGLINLTFIDCSFNSLNNIILVGLNIGVMNCSNNLLTSIDLTNSSISQFDCSYNNISNFIFSNSVFSQFVCSFNSLATLNLTGATISFELDCKNNQISNINFAGNNFSIILCSNNLLTSIDVSIFSNLTLLRCNDNLLISIYAKNGKNEFIGFNNNPNLILICCDESQIANIQSNANPSVVVVSYCTFTPGGDYNTIFGTTRYDSNNNGCDISDPVFNFQRIDFTDGTNSGSTFTNNSGNFKIYVQQPNITLTPYFENSTYFNVTPANVNISLPLNNNTAQVQDFCVTPNGIHNDLEIVLTPFGQVTIGEDSNYMIVYKNKGNQILSGNVSLTFDDNKTDFVSSTPNINNQLLNVLTWNYSNLIPFESRIIYLRLNLNGTISITDLLLFNATINPVSGDEMPIDNVFELNQPVNFNYFPNSVTCLQGESQDSSEIGNYLHYNIQFENTGTTSVSNVVIKNTIDTAKLDINTIKILNASAPVRTVITNNIVEFIFEGINLARKSGTPPVGGHGDVLFKIKTKPTLTNGDSVLNKANIYFDYNFPIVSNDAITTFATLSSQIFNIDESVSVSPNPTNSIININNNVKSIELYDVQARMLETALNTNVIDISNKTNGIYFLKITTEKGSKIEKVIKE